MDLQALFGVCSKKSFLDRTRNRAMSGDTFIMHEYEFSNDKPSPASGKRCGHADSLNFENFFFSFAAYRKQQNNLSRMRSWGEQ